jgi:GntR family negative regulator for fad regulon and positive regulator of fabA
MEPRLQSPLRPTQYAEHMLVTSILDGTYPCGSALPAERSLAEQIGITRPTLRETLQRLAGEGWVKIQHGKPTVVNDFWSAGGLSMLGTLAKYGDYLPSGFITRLLEVRVTLLPPVASLAANRQPRRLLDHLGHRPQQSDTSEVFAAFDWEFQMCMAKESGNPIYSLILNDFALIFQKMAARYFTPRQSRDASLAYYRKLASAIDRQDNSVEKVVEAAMKQSIQIWRAIKRSGNT